MSPLTPSSTSSFKLRGIEGVEVSDAFVARGREHNDWTHQAKSNEQTGSPQPNISTIFIGRSKADELE